MTYTQCKLRRGAVEQMAWVPSKLAVAGKYLMILDRDGWQVIAAYSTQDETYVLEHERDYRHAFASIS